MEDKNPNETPHQTTLRVIQTLKNALHLDVEIPDIDIAHRSGQFLKNGDRPIICKFETRLKRHEVIKGRKKLKGTSIVIKEDLTVRNLKRMNDVRAVENVTNVWSDEGKIIALLDSNDKVLIDYKKVLTKPIVPKRLQKKASSEAASTSLDTRADKCSMGPLFVAETETHADPGEDEQNDLFSAVQYCLSLCYFFLYKEIR